MGRRFKKIKFDGKNVTLLWEEGDSYQNEYSLKCDELPAPGMVIAFDELRYEALLLCELPDEYLDRIDVRSVSLNYGGPEETMGATITARMQLFYSNAPLNLNTPNKPVEPYSAECEYDDEVLAKHLAVMDLTATSLAMENDIPVVVFALADPQNIVRAVMGEPVGTVVTK